MFLRYHTTPGRYTPGMLLFLMDRDRLSRLAAVAGRVRLLVVAPSVPTHRTISTNVYLVMVLVTKEERDPLKIQQSVKKLPSLYRGRTFLSVWQIQTQTEYQAITRS